MFSTSNRNKHKSFKVKKDLVRRVSYRQVVPCRLVMKLNFDVYTWYYIEPRRLRCSTKLHWSNLRFILSSLNSNCARIISMWPREPSQHHSLCRLWLLKSLYGFQMLCFEHSGWFSAHMALLKLYPSFYPTTWQCFVPLFVILWWHWHNGIACMDVIRLTYNWEMRWWLNSIYICNYEYRHLWCAQTGGLCCFFGWWLNTVAAWLNAFLKLTFVPSTIGFMHDDRLRLPSILPLWLKASITL